MATGTVKFFNKGESFGYIVPDEGGDDVHFSWSSWADSVSVPDMLRVTSPKTPEDERRVEYDVDLNEKGGHAVNLRVAA